MLKSLSRSTTIMFLFDFTVILVSSLYWYKNLELSNSVFILSVFLTVIFGLITLFLKDDYKIREFNITSKNSYLLFEGCVISQIPTLILLLFFVKSWFTVKILVLNLLTIYLILRFYRILYHLYLFYAKRTKNVLIIGANKNARLIADEIIGKKALKMNVVGFIADIDDDNYIIDSKTPIYPNSENLKKLIKDKKVDIVIIALKRRMEEALLTNLINSIPNRVEVFDMPDFYELITGKLYIDTLSINRLFHIHMKHRSLVYDFCKRVFDIVSALIILGVTFPILFYIGLRVKLTDGGPIIFTQNRVGKGGKIFKAYKMRTMYLNNFKPTESNIKEANNQNEDDRVIPFCKWVRRARFDEIPQMINILKGEMSIVGPRAEWEELVKIYKNKIPYYSYRELIKTGWTGWAQINQGHCITEEDIKEKLEYDIYFIKHKNVVWEIGILIKAVFLALGGRHC